jgi:peptide chain release factor 1
MNQSIRDKLEHLTGRLDELDRMLASGDATQDMDEYRKLSREHAELGPVVALYQTWRQARAICRPVSRCSPIRKCGNWPKPKWPAARARLPQIEEDLQKLLLPKDAKDDRNVFLEIRAGTGGDESALFAGNLFRMYTRYAERRRWQVEVISASVSDLGGYRKSSRASSAAASTRAQVRVGRRIACSAFRTPRRRAAFTPRRARWR